MIKQALPNIPEYWIHVAPNGSEFYYPDEAPDDVPTFSVFIIERTDGYWIEEARTSLEKVIFRDNAPPLLPVPFGTGWRLAPYYGSSSTIWLRRREIAA